MNNVMEFYDGVKIIATVQSAIVPLVGNMVSINKVSWEVTGVSFAVDYTTRPMAERVLRCNVDLKRAAKR